MATSRRLFLRNIFITSLCAINFDVKANKNNASNIKGNYNLSPLYYGVFFAPITHNILFYYSNDGVHFSQPQLLYFDEGKDNRKKIITGRDPSIIYYSGRWYLAVTAGIPDIRDFVIYHSKDLVHWECENIKLYGDSPICSSINSRFGGSEPAKFVWAPEWSLVNNNLYLSISVYLGKDENFAEVKNKFCIVLSEVINIDTFTFSTPKKLSILDNPNNATCKLNKYSRIDSFIVRDKKNERYIMACKRENFGILDTFESISIGGPYHKLGEISLHNRVFNNAWLDIEGPTIYKINESTWIVAFDTYTNSTGILYVSTTDFVNFSEVRRLHLGGNSANIVRHGTIQRSNNIECNEVIFQNMILPNFLSK